MELRDVLELFQYYEGDGQKVSVTEGDGFLCLEKTHGMPIKLIACPELHQKIEGVFGEKAIPFKTDDLLGSQDVNVFMKDQFIMHMSFNMEEIAEGTVSIMCEWLDNDETYIGKTKDEMEHLMNIFEQTAETLKEIVKEEIKEWHEYRMYFATQDIAFVE